MGRMGGEKDTPQKHHETHIYTAAFPPKQREMVPQKSPAHLPENNVPDPTASQPTEVARRGLGPHTTFILSIFCALFALADKCSLIWAF